jgi:hypothetical protein
MSKQQLIMSRFIVQPAAVAGARRGSRAVVMTLTKLHGQVNIKKDTISKALTG